MLTGGLHTHFSSTSTFLSLQILSIWVMAVLLVHLDKKLTTSAETLDDTNAKLKSLEEKRGWVILEVTLFFFHQTL